MLKLKTLSLKKQITVLIFTLGVTMLVTSLASMVTYTKQLTTTIENNQKQYSKQLHQKVENTYVDIHNISQSIAYNKLVHQYLMETNSSEKFNLYQNLINLFDNMKILNNNIVDIAILGESGNTINISGDISIYQDLYEDIDTSSWRINYFGKVDFVIMGKPYISQVIAEPIYELSGTNKKLIGVLFITVNPFTLFKEFSIKDNSLLPNDIVFVDKNHDLIVGDELIYEVIKENQSDQDIFFVTVDKEKYKVRQASIQNFDATLYTFVSHSKYQKGIVATTVKNIFFIILIFSIATLILLTVVKSIMKSLAELNKIMDRISSGERKSLNERIIIDPEKSYCKEVVDTSIAFNNMLDEINVLNNDIFNNYTQMYEMEMTNRKAEISFLRSQINPHFLYNTLTLICGMASANEFNGIIDVTQALSKIFRYSIERDDLVTVAQELEIIKSYVMIQTTRFDDRFSVSYNFTPETLTALVPCMIIQPIVENAITHGLEKSLKKGKLEVGGRINHTDHTLVLWVYDTGVGIPKERLVSIRKSLHDFTYVNNTEPFAYEDIADQKEISIGLYNVNRRIALYFGHEFRLHIDSTEHMETNVQIKIPYQQA